MRGSILWLSTTALLIGSACGGDKGECGLGDGVRVRFDPSFSSGETLAEEFVSFPWPSDHRVTEGGAPDLGNYPNPWNAQVLEDYLVLAEEKLDGFSTTAGVHFAFEGPIDPTSLPEDFADYVTADAPVQILDVTPGSPEYGTRRPVRWLWTQRGDGYVAANSLVVAPHWGFPLRESTTYAVVLTNDILDADGDGLGTPVQLAELLGLGTQCLDGAGAAGEPLTTVFAPLRTLLENENFDRRRIAAATVFTTQSITASLRAIHDHVASLPAPLLEPDWQPIGQNGANFKSMVFDWRGRETVRYYAMEGRFDAPNYQEGSIPYSSSGGGFRFVNGVPQVVRTETLSFVVTWPQAPPVRGSCYPVVEYAHGTGGDRFGFHYSTAGRLTARGLAGIGIDQPLHGDRKQGLGFDPSFYSFNFANMDAARTLFRQSAVDTFSLTRFLAAGNLVIPAADSPTGQEICFESTGLSFFGHSHGGISGALALPFEPDIDTWLLSGAGGGISISILERKDPVDFKALFEFLAQIESEDVPLSELHPVVSLVQMLIDVTDPINYSPHWLDPNGTQPSLLVTSGELDQATHWRSATAMSVAGRVPILMPVFIPTPEYELLGVDYAQAPLAGNLDNGNTAGFIQWRNQDHFVVFDLPEAINASMRLFESAAFETNTVIERDPFADVN